MTSASMDYMRQVKGDDEETAQAADDFLSTMRNWADLAEDVQLQGFGAVLYTQKSIQELFLDL